MSWLSIYELDREVMNSDAEVQSEAMQNGEPLPDFDLLIALSGKADSELLTLDEQHVKMKARLEAKGVTVSTLRDGPKPGRGK